MARFSSRLGRWVSGQRHSSLPREDPYSPTSANYAARHKVRESEFIGLPGLVRVDIGEPVKRLAGEAPANPKASPPPPSEAAAVSPTVRPKASPKEHRAITREP